MGSPHTLVSADALAALREFSTEFDGVLAVAPPETTWAAMLGRVRVSDALKTTFPIPISAAGYHEFKGDMKYRHLGAKSLSMTPKTWQDGVEELAAVIEAPDFIGWEGEPGRMAVEASRLPNLLVATILAANPTLEFDGKALFANDHPCNVLDSSVGTIDNLHTATGINAAMIVAAKKRFRAKKGPNGKPLGLRLDTLLVPAAREEEAKDFLENDLLIEAIRNEADDDNVGGVTTNNRHKGTVRLVVGDELSDDDAIFALDTRKGISPWIVQVSSAVEQIVHDKTSAKYKETLKVAIAMILKANGSAALPHAIEKITL